ncbi:MAG: T9SS type A sorting domain-containing protein [Paludibacter sp.]|nr:T9SS type A sorting domain-containing protein [Paludibacter sp.]
MISTLKRSKIIFINILFILAVAQNTFAINYYQRQSGNWNNPLTWTTSSSSKASVNTGTYPQVTDNVHIYNNGNQANITLTEDAECANLYFDNSAATTVIAMGDYNLTITGAFTSDEGNNATITQSNGYLQINGGIPTFRISKTISNLRVGSSSFYLNFVPTDPKYLTVTSNYDFYCYQSSIPAGINADTAIKLHPTPCSPTLSATTLADFGATCPGTTVGPSSFKISSYNLNSSNITIGALAGFSYSTTTNGTYTNSLTLTQSGGNYSQTIYVKFTPIGAISYNGSIPVSGGGASQINVSAIGTGSTSVAPKVNSPVASNITSSSATLGATIIVSGCSELVTERGFYYSTTNDFSDGTGTRIAESGSFETGEFALNISGLSSSTTYYFKAYATNSNGTTYSSQGTFNNMPLTYYSRQSGNWNDPNTWTTAGCGNSTNTGTYPLGFDNVVLCQQHNITVNTTGLSCNNLDMSAYATHLILSNDFNIYGNLLLTNQSYVSAGSNNLTIRSNFTNTPGEYNSRIDYSTGNITIGGNITVAKNGYEPFNCSGSGWLIMSGISKTFTAVSAISVTRFKQPATGFTKAGTGTINISNSFDQNWGPTAPSGINISIPNNSLNNSFKYFRSLSSGNWSSVSTWQQSGDGISNWLTATSTPANPDGIVTIQSGHTVSLSENTEVNSLTLNNGATFEVNGGKKLTIFSTLTNNATFRLLSDAAGTATLLTQGTIGGTGTYKVQQYFNSNRNWYMSSPFTNTTAPSNFSYFSYCEPGDNTSYVSPASLYWKTVTVGSVLNPLTGYIVQPSSTTSTIEFSGSALNNGTTSTTLTRTVGKDKEGYNLIGNPYPSYLNWTAASKTDIEPTLWYRTKNNSGTYVYDTFNGVGTNNNQRGAVTANIPPMQAFWARVSSGKTSGTLNFTNALRSHNDISTNIFRAPKVENQQVLRLQVSNSANSDEAILLFNPDASNTIDTFDSPKMTNSNADIPEIFTLVDTEELVINGMSNYTLNTEIPLGVRPGNASEIGIKITEFSNFDSDIHTYLKDVLENKIIDITDQKYLISNPTTSNDRFSIIFKTITSTTGIDIVNNQQILITKNSNNQIIVNCSDKLNGDNLVTVSNIIGQKIVDKKMTTTSTVINIPNDSGVYLVTVINNGMKITKRVILN